jgi:hypothetical protein
MLRALKRLLAFLGRWQGRRPAGATGKPDGRCHVRRGPRLAAAPSP